MEGILVEVKLNSSYDIVDTRNNKYGRLRMYYSIPKPPLRTNTTVRFEIHTSSKGNTYAKFISVVDRNKAIFNTEDRSQWYALGEGEEDEFILDMVPRMNLDIRKNPEKEHCSWAIDLFDYTNNRLADLKTQNTPFFTVSKYKYKGVRLNPAYSVTFNRKDYEHYKQYYPDCDIYFWVHWKQKVYNGITVKETNGVWRGNFAKMAACIESGLVPLHSYVHRKDDDYNAKESYIFNLLDTEVFEQIV